MKYKFIFISVTLLLILVGCNQNEEIQKDDDFLLTYIEVFNTLTDNGLELSENKSIDTEAFKLYYTNPKILDMENSETLLIYIFSDMKGREVAEEELSIRRDQIVELFDENDIFSVGTFVAKNVLLVYTVSEENKYEFDLFNKINTIVFENLNDGEEILYTGSGEYWEGEILVKYYGHWWEDENGNFIDYDNSRIETGKLHYKDNVDDVATFIDYEITGRLGSFSGGDHELGKDGYIETGISSGNGTSPKNDTIYTVTVNWNNKVEIFELKAE